MKRTLLASLSLLIAACGSPSSKSATAAKADTGARLVDIVASSGIPLIKYAGTDAASGAPCSVDLSTVREDAKIHWSNQGAPAATSLDDAAYDSCPDVAKGPIDTNTFQVVSEYREETITEYAARLIGKRDPSDALTLDAFETYSGGDHFIVEASCLGLETGLFFHHWENRCENLTPAP